MRRNWNINLFVLAITSLLAITSCSGNSSLGVATQDYNDFTMSFIKEEDCNSYYLTTFHINNTGSGFIEYISVKENYENNNYLETDTQDYRNSPFASGLILPNSEQDYVFLTMGKGFDDKNNLTYTAKAYTSAGGTGQIKGTPSIGKIGDYDYFVSGIEIMGALMMKRPTTVNYGVIMSVVYDEQTYYFACDEDHSYHFASTRPLDLSKMSKVEVYRIITSAKPNPFEGRSGAMLSSLLFFGIIVLINSCIFLPIFITKTARRKRRNAQLKKKSVD